MKYLLKLIVFVQDQQNEKKKGVILWRLFNTNCLFNCFHHNGKPLRIQKGLHHNRLQLP